MNTFFHLLLLLAALALSWWVLTGRWSRDRRLSGRERGEDALKYILKREANGRSPTLEGIAGSLDLRRNTVSELLDGLAAQGLVTLEGGRISLTPAGRELALHVVRSHRLWESYLADQTGVSEERWHEDAEKAEHRLSPGETAALAARLGHPTLDPHGDEIPGEGGLAGDPGQSLNAADPGRLQRIVHLEDEPPAVYAQLVALGLRPGMNVRVLERSAERLTLWAAGREHTLAPMLAQNVAVVPAPPDAAGDIEDSDVLESLRPGQTARVLGLAPACRGPQRRRLLDFGFVPGTAVEVDMISPVGDPTAYRIRGSVVALRSEQARLVRISPPEEAA